MCFCKINYFSETAFYGLLCFFHQHTHDTRNAQQYTQHTMGCGASRPPPSQHFELKVNNIPPGSKVTVLVDNVKVDV